MIEEKPAADRTEEEGEVVYRRPDALAGEAQRAGAKKGLPLSLPAEGKIAPALVPLIIGIMLLLTLVFALGRLSVRQLDHVTESVLTMERQYAAKLNLLLNLRIAVTKLNNEARARARTEASEGPNAVIPLFDQPLRNARKEVNDLLGPLENPVLVQVEKWSKLRSDVESFVAATNDLRTYSLEGFPRFRTVDTELNEMLREVGKEQLEIPQRRETLRDQAVRRINQITIVATLIGLLVAVGTVLEVQRRFRQMRQSLEEIRRERQFSTQMLEGMVSAVAAVDERHRIISANSAFFEIFPQATIGASVHDKFAAPSALKMLEAATATRADRATYRGRWVLEGDAMADGVARTFDVYSSPLAIDADRGRVITLVDVTEAAEAEHVLRRTESLAAVGQAAAQVAHEIKNPLGSIRLGMSILRDMTRDQEALNTINLVERGVDHLNKLAVDVTQFSRRKPLARSETDLHELVNTSLDLIADRIKEKKAPIEKHFSQQPLRGEWDEDQLRQVLVNLLANAVDASQQGSPITISTGLAESEVGGNGNRGSRGRDKNRAQQYARITIADQGSGMDEATRTRIFEPFFTTKKRGTGLGLAIVKQIIEQHGGNITVESEPSKGSRFTIQLPLQQ